MSGRLLTSFESIADELSLAARFQATGTSARECRNSTSLPAAQTPVAIPKPPTRHKTHSRHTKALEGRNPLAVVLQKDVQSQCRKNEAETTWAAFVLFTASILLIPSGSLCPNTLCLMSRTGPVITVQLSAWFASAVPVHIRCGTRCPLFRLLWQQTKAGSRQNAPYPAECRCPP